MRREAKRLDRTVGLIYKWLRRGFVGDLGNREKAEGANFPSEGLDKAPGPERGKERAGQDHRYGFPQALEQGSRSPISPGLGALSTFSPGSSVSKGAIFSSSQQNSTAPTSGAEAGE